MIFSPKEEFNNYLNFFIRATLLGGICMEVSKLKILVISSSLSNAKYFENIISKSFLKAKVFIAKNKSNGIKLAKLNEPDVIVIDIPMTDTASLEISRIIKKVKSLNVIPILFVTDLEVDRELRNEAIKAGAEGFLQKPLDDAILITQLTAMAKIKERNVLINNQKEQLEALVERRTHELKQENFERKNLEKELRKSEETLKTYIEKAPTGIFVVDSMGKYIEVNTMACELMGLSKEEALKLSLSDFLAPSHLDRGLAGFSELTSKGFIEEEYKVRSKGKEDFWISLRAAKINDDRFIAFCTDISKRKEK